MNLGKIPLWQTFSAALVVVFLGTAGWYYYHVSNRIVWTAVHVSGDRFSGDAHLLELPDGHVVLIDTGFNRFSRSNLIPYLEKRDVRHVDQLVITHAHRNHYGAIGSLLEHLDHIDEIYFNMPPKTRCDKETWSTGCDYDHVRTTRDHVESSGVPLLSMATGNVIYRDQDNDISLEVVYVHDGVSEPPGNTDINDTSAVLRLTYGTTSVLFTGDINRKVGKHLLKQNFFLESDIMTAPHHGVESAASNKFLEKVNAEALIVSNSAGHWLGERGERMRRFAEENDIPAYITGIHGNVVAILTRDSFSIDTQLDPKRGE